MPLSSLCMYLHAVAYLKAKNQNVTPQVPQWYTNSRNYRYHLAAYKALHLRRQSLPLSTDRTDRDATRHDVHHRKEVAENARDTRGKDKRETGVALSDNFRGFRAKLAKWWIDLQSSGWVGRSVTCEIFERQAKRDLALDRACTLGTHIAPTIYDLPTSPPFSPSTCSLFATDSILSSFSHTSHILHPCSSFSLHYIHPFLAVVPVILFVQVNVGCALAGG